MSGKTILVVDDDPVFRSSLTDILSRAGYKAYGASDGRSAYRIAESLGADEVDLMVLEMVLPDMTGAELIHAIAVKQETIIKVIASSSLFSQADMDTQTSFRSDAGIRKEGTALPAIASKWLLTTRSLLGELADSAPAPSDCLILLADDDAAVRHFVRVILNLAGYQVLEAADGESALALARKVAGAVDLVVTDIEMPEMDGLALGRAIRHEHPDVPVIYISGFAEGLDVKHLDDPEQGSGFLAKPFLPDVLLAAVSLLLDKAKKQPG